MQSYAEHAPKLAQTAALEALERGDTKPQQVTHLVSVSCSGFAAPGVDIELIELLGLPATTARTHVGFMGCHGMMNGLRVAQSYAKADADAVVLVVAVETCSLHYQYDWTPQNMVANSLFADGAAACVVRQNAPAKLSLVDHFAELVPGTREAMTWKIADHGFEMTLSPLVPEWIGEGLRPRIEPWLARHKLSVADVSAWCVHPGGPKILEACAHALDLPNEALDASRDVLARCGNMSSPTVMFVLDELLKRGATSPIVMLGFGPGLAIEAALLA
jgi:predicted naringenin-chalcone synthase